MKNETYNQTMSEVRARIAAAKRRGTKQGYIGYHGCIEICDEFLAILKDAEKILVGGDVFLAFCITSLILQNDAKLAGTGDSSSGCVNEVLWTAIELLDTIVDRALLCGDTDLAKDIYSQGLKDCRSKAYDGWDNFAYEQLRRLARLATTATAPKLYTLLDAFMARDKDSGYYSESDCLVRCALVKAVEGEVAADAFAMRNLKYDGIREIAIDRALANQDYAKAERLCLPKTNVPIHPYTCSSDRWHDRLLEIYRASGDGEKYKETLHKILIQMHSAEHFEPYKVLLQKQNLWEAKGGELFAEMRASLRTSDYIAVLAKECMEHELIAELSEHPEYVFKYAKKLSKNHGAEVYPICVRELERSMEKAANRNQYAYVCNDIKRLHSYGGKVEALSVIQGFRERYPRRSAMLEELASMERKLK